MPRMTAVDHAVNYTEWDDLQKKVQHRTVRRGETAEVSEAEVARVEDVRQRELDAHLSGRVVDHRAGHVRWLPEDEYDEYMSAAAPVDPLQAVSDEEIGSWSADETIAKLNQLPGLADRVLDLEEARKPRRRAVVAHAERVKAAADGNDVSQAETAPSLGLGLLPSDQ